MSSDLVMDAVKTAVKRYCGDEGGCDFTNATFSSAFADEVGELTGRRPVQSIDGDLVTTMLYGRKNLKRVGAAHWQLRQGD